MSANGLEAAIAKLKTELPGWWFTVGECHVSCDATVAPDRGGADDYLLNDPVFDRGFDNDLRQPSTLADALLGAIEVAKAARAAAIRARTA